MISSATLFLATLVFHAAAVLGAPISLPAAEIVPRSLDNSGSVHFARDASFPEAFPAIVERAVVDSFPIIARETEDLVRRYPRRFIHEYLEKRGTTIYEKITVTEKTIKHDNPIDTVSYNNGHPQNKCGCNGTGNDAKCNGNSNGNAGCGDFTTTIAFSTTITIPGVPTPTAAPTPTPTGGAGQDPTKPADGTTPDATKPADCTSPDATNCTKPGADGSTPDATTPDGTTPDATKPADGTVPDATKPADGTTPDATKPADGATPAAPADGTAPDGAKPADGANPGGAQPGATPDPTAAPPADGPPEGGATESRRREVKANANSQPIAKRDLAYSGAAWASSLRRRAL
jgi:hypothetical protein